MLLFNFFQTKCQSFNSYLLEINSESEQNWLKDKGTRLCLLSHIIDVSNRTSALHVVDLISLILIYQFQEAVGGQAPEKMKIKTFGYGIIPTLKWSLRTGIRRISYRTEAMMKIVFCQCLDYGMIILAITLST